MGWEQIFGFIISILAIAYVIGRNIFEQIQRRNHPEDYAKKKHEQEEALQKFLRSLKEDMEETKGASYESEEEEKRHVRHIPTPPPKPMPIRKNTVPRTVKDEFRLKTKYDHYKAPTEIEQRQLKTTIEERFETKKLGADVVSSDMRMDDAARAYDIPKQTEQVARGKTLLQGLHSRKKMIVIHEILSRPKGLT